MQFYTPGNKSGSYGARESWITALNNPGASQLIYLKTLMLKYHFETLFPDQSVLKEPGERYNHLVALRGKTCLLVYTYNGRPINLNVNQLSGTQFSYKWYCPRTGKVIKTGRFKKDEVREFNPPGLKGNGNDWVLILENI